MEKLSRYSENHEKCESLAQQIFPIYGMFQEDTQSKDYDKGKHKTQYLR